MSVITKWVGTGPRQMLLTLETDDAPSTGNLLLRQDRWDHDGLAETHHFDVYEGSSWLSPKELSSKQPIIEGPEKGQMFSCVYGFPLKKGKYVVVCCQSDPLGTGEFEMCANGVYGTTLKLLEEPANTNQEDLSGGNEPVLTAGTLALDIAGNTDDAFIDEEVDDVDEKRANLLLEKLQVQKKPSESSSPAVDEKSTRQLREIFDQFDKDHSGFFDLKELGSLLRHTGLPCTKQQATAIRKFMDKNSNGKIERSEFEESWPAVESALMAIHREHVTIASAGVPVLPPPDAPNRVCASATLSEWDPTDNQQCASAVLKEEESAACSDAEVMLKGNFSYFILNVQQRAYIDVMLVIGNAKRLDAALSFIVASAVSKATAEGKCFSHQKASRIFTSKAVHGRTIQANIGYLEPGKYVIFPLRSVAESTTVTLRVSVGVYVPFGLSANDLIDFDIAVVDGCEDSSSISQTASDTFPQIVKEGRKMIPFGSRQVEVYSVDGARRVVDSVTKKASGEAKHFIDEKFPHEQASLGPAVEEKFHDKHKNLEWLRPETLLARKNRNSSESGNRKKKTTVGDCVQGSVGDCWLISAVSAMAHQQPDKVTKLFYPTHYNPAGIYSVNVYLKNDWWSVLVDDYLPCSRGKPAFLSSQGQTELWSSLLEKAIAKLHGSYFALAGSQTENTSNDTNETLSVLTGAGIQTLQIGGSQGMLQRTGQEHWFEEAKKALAKGALVTVATIKPSGLKSGDITEHGLVVEHAYSLLGVLEVEEEEVKKHEKDSANSPAKSSAGGARGVAEANKNTSPKTQMKMVKLRNPWGRKEWTGRFHDGDPLWSQFPKTEKACRMQEVKALIDDGIFWMDAEDVEANFRMMTIGNFLDEGSMSNKVTVEGEWRNKMDGGNITYDTLENEQVLLVVKEPNTQVNIKFSMHPRPPEIFFLNLAIVKFNSQHEHRLSRADVDAGTIFHATGHQASADVEIQEPGMYSIITTSTVDGAACKWTMAIVASNPIEARLLPKVAQIKPFEIPSAKYKPAHVVIDLTAIPTNEGGPSGLTFLFKVPAEDPPASTKRDKSNAGASDSFQLLFGKGGADIKKLPSGKDIIADSGLNFTGSCTLVVPKVAAGQKYSLWITRLKKTAFKGEILVLSQADERMKVDIV